MSSGSEEIHTLGIPYRDGARSPGLRRALPGRDGSFRGGRLAPLRIVVDTNVVVAAGFRPGSRSAEILGAARDGRIHLVWNDETRAETERVVRKVPPLSWGEVADVFRPEQRHDGPTAPEDFGLVPDPTDRKFAALAAAANAVLVTSDDHLLGVR